MTEQTEIEETEVAEVLAETPEAAEEDLDFMLDGDTPTPAVEEIVVEEEVAPVEPAENPEVPVVETPVETPTAQPIPDAVTSELQALKAQQQELLDYVAQLKAEHQPEVAPEPELEAIEFIKTDEELREVFDSPGGFNKLLNQIYRAATAKGREMALQAVPEIAQTNAREVYDHRSLIRNFYSANPELLPHVDAIKATAVKLAAENNYTTYAQLLEATEKAVRAEKGIVKQIPKAAPILAAKPPQKQPLAFPGGSGGARKPSPAALSKAQQDIADILF